MSFELIRNPGSSLARARKSRNMSKSVNVLLTSSFLLSVALVFAVFRVSALSATPLMIVSLGAVAFFMTILLAMVFGWTTQIIATTVGGKGRYYEGFTAVAYSIFAPSLGLLVASLMTADDRSSRHLANFPDDIVPIFCFGRGDVLSRREGAFQDGHTFHHGDDRRDDN